MLLLVRCDAGAQLGVGHAVRSLALAEAASAHGHKVRWCGRLDDVPWLCADPLLDGSIVVPPEDDPVRLARLATEIGADAVHIDHYGLAGSLRAALGAASLVLSNVEDFRHGRRPADIVVDPNLGAENHARPSDGSARLLRGLNYALLRRSILESRHGRADARVAGSLPRVLVVMGGTDAAGLLDPVLDALHAAAVPAEVDVIVPPGHVLRPTAGNSLRLHASPPRVDLPRLMARADLVVSAAGTTVWELCCIGAPMALVRATDNQTEGYAAVVAAGAGAGLGGPGEVYDVEATAGTLRTLLRDANARAELSRRARGLVDGLGATRVLAALEDLIVPRTPFALRARPASAADAELLHEWRNDETTRQWSRSSDPIAWHDHLQWLCGSLARDDRLLLIVENAEHTPVGTVRWDRGDDQTWEVSVTVAPQHRGRGLAGPVLRAGEQALLKREGPGTVVRACVHRDNAASHALFARAGYRPDGAAGAAGFAPHRKPLG